MKVINETTLPTYVLMALSRESYRLLRISRPPLKQWRRVKIRFYWMKDSSKKLSIGGATFRGTRVQVGIRKLWYGDPFWEGMAMSWDPRRVARTLTHELLHLYGVRHASMTPLVTARRKESERMLKAYEWANWIVQRV